MVLISLANTFETTVVLINYIVKLHNDFLMLWIFVLGFKALHKFKEKVKHCNLLEKNTRIFQ